MHRHGRVKPEVDRGQYPRLEVTVDGDFGTSIQPPALVTLRISIGIKDTS